MINFNIALSMAGTMISWRQWRVNYQYQNHRLDLAEVGFCCHCDLYITANSLCFVNSSCLVSFTNYHCIKHLVVTRLCLNLCHIKFCYRSESHLLGMTHSTKDPCLVIGRAVSGFLSESFPEVKLHVIMSSNKFYIQSGQ